MMSEKEREVKKEENASKKIALRTNGCLGGELVREL
jgi:hypothetical protein